MSRVPFAAATTTLRALLAVWRSGQLTSIAYETAVVSGIPRLRGWLALSWFRSVYRNFSHGSGTRCWGRPIVVVADGGSIRLGDGVWLLSDGRKALIALHSPCKLHVLRGATIVIGDNVVLNGTSITARNRVEIGADTMIAANVVIVDSDFHRHWPPHNRMFSSPDNDRPVSIGSNVWIGLGSIILKGSHIGDNSIIAAGSVVTGSIPAGVIAAGAPARVIRRLDASDGEDGDST